VPTAGAHEWQALSPVVHGERAGGEECVEKLAAAVREPGGVTAGRAVVEVDVDLLHRQPGSEHVDRHPHLAAEPGCERKAGGAGTLAEAALARERLAGREARPQEDELPRDALGDPEPTAHAAGERGHAKVGVSLGEGCERSPQVGVAQEQRARRGHPLARAQRLALPSCFETQHDRAGLLRCRGGAVGGGSVDDEDLCVAELGPQGLDRLADPLHLIAGRNEDRELSHSGPARRLPPGRRRRSPSP